MFFRILITTVQIISPLIYKSTSNLVRKWQDFSIVVYVCLFHHFIICSLIRNEKKCVQRIICEIGWSSWEQMQVGSDLFTWIFGFEGCNERSERWYPTEGRLPELHVSSALMQTTAFQKPHGLTNACAKAHTHTHLRLCCHRNSGFRTIQIKLVIVSDTHSASKTALRCSKHMLLRRPKWLTDYRDSCFISLCNTSRFNYKYNCTFAITILSSCFFHIEFDLFYESCGSNAPQVHILHNTKKIKSKIINKAHHSILKRWQ